MKKVVYIIMFFTIFSCKKNINNSKKDVQSVYFGYTNEEAILIDNFSFYEDKNSIYIHIIDSLEIENLKKKPIKSITIKFKNEIFEGKIIEAAFSREIDLKPFICYTYNNGYISFEKMKERELIYIGNKNDLSTLLENKIVKPLN